jgi:hypothetical protein
MRSRSRSSPRGVAAEYAVPQLSIHRGRFQLALLDIARRRLGAGAVRSTLRHKYDEAGLP